MHIDYGTWTTNDPTGYENCRGELGDWKLEESPKKQEFHGFRGLRWDKQDHGTRFVGLRDIDGYALISCSGYVAHVEALRLRFLGHWRPSRIDVAVDVEQPFDVPSAYAAWQGETSTKVSAISNQTLYIGSRKSELFWRVYDKAAELGRMELSPLWRIELELKGERAKQLWKGWKEGGETALPGLLKAYLWKANGSPREPAHSLLHSYLEATEAWYLEPLPRRKRAGEAYLWQNIIPFLRDNWEWAGPVIVEQLVKGYRECTFE